MTNDRNTVYNRQLGMIYFMISLNFKVAKLPSLLVEAVGNSNLVIIILLSLLDLAMLGVVMRISQLGVLEEIEKHKNKVLYKALMLVLAGYFLFKLGLMYGGVVQFVLDQLFENIDAIWISITLIIPICYLAYKGFNTIARVCELFIWYLFIVIAINFCFLDAQLDWSRNLPLFDGNAMSTLMKGGGYAIWFGDALPFLFLTVKKNKVNYVKFLGAASLLVISATYVVMNAMYGKAAVYITNFIVKLSGFNMFSDKLGRLDWVGMVAWVINSCVYLAVFFWATMQAGRKVADKPRIIAALIIIAIIIVDAQTVSMSSGKDFAESPFKYLGWFCNYALPLILLIIYAVYKKKEKKGLKASLTPSDDKQLTKRPAEEQL